MRRDAFRRVGMKQCFVVFTQARTLLFADVKIPGTDSRFQKRDFFSPLRASGPVFQVDD